MKYIQIHLLQFGQQLAENKSTGFHPVFLYEMELTVEDTAVWPSKGPVLGKEPSLFEVQFYPLGVLLDCEFHMPLLE